MEFIEVTMAIHWLIKQEWNRSEMKHEIKQTILYSTWLQEKMTEHSRIEWQLNTKEAQ